MTPQMIADLDEMVSRQGYFGGFGGLYLATCLIKSYSSAAVAFPQRRLSLPDAAPALLTAGGRGAIKRAMKTPFAIIGICIIG